MINILIVILYVILLLSSEHMRDLIEGVASIAGEEEAVDYYLENAVFQQGGSGLGNIIKVFTLLYLAVTFLFSLRSICVEYKEHTKSLLI